MTHPLESLLSSSKNFLLIGDSSQDRFPGYSFNAYIKTNTPFYCFDMGGLTLSRGPSPDLKVYTELTALPDDLGDLAIIWVKPGRAQEAVELAHEAGCSLVWFSFQTGHPKAVALASSLGMEVVEIGRCPVYYLKHPDKPLACKLHTAVCRASGTLKKSPQLDPHAKHRELV